MDTSTSTINVYTGLFNVTKEIQTLKKEATGYNYKYLTLESIITYLKPILDKHGLVYIQMVGLTFNGCIGLTTRLIHAETGEFIENEASIPLTDMKGVNKSQGAGAAITYLRRYSLTALFGIAENDTDGLTKEELEKRNEPVNPTKKPREQASTTPSATFDTMLTASQVKGLNEMKDYYEKSKNKEGLKYLTELRKKSSEEVASALLKFNDKRLQQIMVN